MREPAYGWPIAEADHSLAGPVMLVFRQQLPYRCRGSSPAGAVLPLPARVLHREAVTSRATAAGEQSPGAAKTLQQPLLADRVLFIGGLPGDLDAGTLHKQISTACVQSGHHPTLIEVARFVDDSQRSRFTFGWKHKGYALVAFITSAAVSAVAAAVKQVPGWGAQAVLGPARKLPKHWTPEITLSPEELQNYQHQQAAATVRRSHNKRQRQRQQQRLISSVAQILHGLPAPGGTAVLQQYKPLMGSWGWGSADHSSSSSVTCCESQISDNEPVDSDIDRLRSYTAEFDLHNDDGDCHVITQLISAMPPPLRSVIIKDHLQQLLLQCQQQQQPQQLIRLAAAPSVDEVSLQLLFDWSKIPAVIDPAFGGQLADAGVVRAGKGPMNMRALRKRVQVESFALLLLQLTLPALQSGKALHIVEFGCGSGNLVLPLAHLFPGFQFTAVDMKHSAVQLLQQRVQQAQITNVRVLEGTIEGYSGDADVVLALHACGAASDWSLLQAKRCGAAFIVSPCCIGKINKDNTAGLLYGKHERLVKRDNMELQETGSAQFAASAVQGIEQQPMMPHPRQVQEQLQYPRSQWLTECMGMLAERVRQEQQQDTAVAGSHVGVLTPLQQAALAGEEVGAETSGGLFSLLAQAADYSHQEQHGYPELAALAKSNVEFDRARSMSEFGYAVELVRLLQPELTAKSDVLVGAPSLEMDFGSMLYKVGVGKAKTRPLFGPDMQEPLRYAWDSLLSCNLPPAPNSLAV